MEHANFSTKFEEGIYLVCHNPEKKYKELRLIGKGGNGVVIEAKHRESGEHVAIKKVPVKKSKDSLKRQLREIEILASVQECPYIVGYKECLFIKHKFISELFDKKLSEDRQLWYVMELCGLDIYECLRVIKHPFSIPQILSIGAQILLALKFIHSKNIVHRDIKGLNVLTTASGRIKVCDFGASEFSNDKGHDQLKNVVTSLWMAPEMFKDGSVYHSEVDIWSFGVTMLEMHHIRVPFQELQQTFVWGAISSLPTMSEDMQRSALGIPSNPELEDLSTADLETQLYEFIYKCLNTDQLKRPKASDLLEDPFINEIVKELLTLEQSPCLYHSGKDIGERDISTQCSCSNTLQPLIELYKEVEETLNQH